MDLITALGDIGFAVQMGPEGCGLIVDHPSSSDLIRIGLRADIDALHIQDAKKAVRKHGWAHHKITKVHRYKNRKPLLPLTKSKKKQYFYRIDIKIMDKNKEKKVGRRGTRR